MSNEPVPRKIPDSAERPLPGPNLHLFAITQDIFGRLRPKNALQTVEYAAAGTAVAVASLFALRPDARQAVLNMLAQPFGTDRPVAAAPLPGDYVAPPILTPEPSATPTPFIPSTTTPAPSETPTPAPSETPKPPVTSKPTIRHDTPTPKHTPGPTITREPTATYEQLLLKQINSLSKTSILPTLFDDISKHKGPTAALNKDGEYVLSVVNSPVDSFTFYGSSTRSLGIVVTADYKVLQGNARPNGIFITTDWLTNPNRNLIEVRRFYSDLLKKEIFTVMYGTMTDNVFHGIEVPLPPHQSPNPVLAMLFSPDMKTFTLSELSPDGKSLNVLSGISFEDLKDGAGNKVFPKDTFTDFIMNPAGRTVHNIYFGIGVRNGHQMTVSRFDLLY